MAPKAKRPSDEASKGPKAKKAKAASALEGITTSAFLKAAPIITVTFTWPGQEEPIVVEAQPTKNKTGSIGWGWNGKFEVPVTAGGSEHLLPTTDSVNITVSKSKGLDPGSDVEEEEGSQEEEEEEEEEEKPKAKGKAKKPAGKATKKK